MTEKAKNQLMEIIKEGENVHTEFKEAYDKLPKNLFETICAFLNRNRWKYIFGGI